MDLRTVGPARLRRMIKAMASEISGYEAVDYEQSVSADAVIERHWADAHCAEARRQGICVSPGAIIVDELEARGINAETFCIRYSVNYIQFMKALIDEITLTDDMIDALAAFTTASVQFWKNLRENYLKCEQEHVDDKQPNT